MAGSSRGWDRSEVGPVRGADGTCPVSRKVLRCCPGLDMGDRISPLRFVLEHITDIAAIEGHAGIPTLLCPLRNTIRIFRVF
jgi:hypothetical protein